MEGNDNGLKILSPEGTATILFFAYARRSHCIMVSSVLHACVCSCSLSFCLKQTPVRDMTAILVSSLTAEAALQTRLWMRWWYMFHTVVLLVLIGLLLFLRAVMICSRLPFVMPCFTVTLEDFKEHTGCTLRH